jgi:hypothetical protein
MDSIKLFNDDLHLFERDCFILIKPNSFRYKVGNRYVFTKSSFNDNYLGRRLLKFKQDFLLSDIPANDTWLVKNCDKQTFLEIQQTLYNSKLTDSFSVLIFSNVESPEYIQHQHEMNFQKNKMI